MFSKSEVGIFEWLFFNILIAIPLVNLIVIVVVLLDGNTNRTLKNYVWSYVVMFFILLGLLFTVFSSYIYMLLNM